MSSLCADRHLSAVALTLAIILHVSFTQTDLGCCACAALHLFHSAVHLTQDSAWCRYGITHTLDQVFEAPPVVKHVMTDEANLNEAYVGTRYGAAKNEVWLLTLDGARIM